MSAYEAPNTNFDKTKESTLGASEIPKINPDNYQPDEESIFKIVGLSDAEKEANPDRKDRQDLRRDKLEKFKADITEQRKHIANLANYIETVGLRSDPNDPDLNKKLGLIIDEDENLTKGQKSQFYQVLEEADKYQHKIRTFKNLTDDWEPREIYQYLFGVPPLGHIQVDYRALSIDIESDEPADLKPFQLNKSPDNASNKKLLGLANFTTADPELDGLVTFSLNRYGADITQETKRHEERHVVDNLLHKTLDSSPRSTKDYDSLLHEAEKRAKSEIFAYLRDGTSLEDIQDILLRPKHLEGGYDYLEILNDVKGLYAKTDEVIENTQTKYKTDLISALAVVETMLEAGYSRNLIISSLQTEALDQWPKIFKRNIANQIDADTLKEASELAEVHLNHFVRDQESDLTRLQTEWERNLSRSEKIKFAIKKVWFGESVIRNEFTKSNKYQNYQSSEASHHNQLNIDSLSSKIDLIESALNKQI
jgi:hypothetical protein